MARLRGEVLSAAEREASEIVTTARTEIRRIIVNARHDLFGLAAQIQVITDNPSDANALDASPSVEGLLPAPEGLHLRDRMLDARRDVRRVFGDARPEIDELIEGARAVRPDRLRRVSDGLRHVDERMD